MFTHRKLQVEARAHILTLYSHPPKTTQLCHDLLHMGYTQDNTNTQEPAPMLIQFFPHFPRLLSPIWQEVQSGMDLSQ